MSTAPTWYDLLDVEQTAPADEIRSAWKRSIADLDPTDRRFQRLSEAAAVLLDEQRRAEYDAGLRDHDGAEPQPTAEEQSGSATRRRWRKRRQLPADLPAGAAASAVGELSGTEPGISDIEPAPVKVGDEPAAAASSGRRTPLLTRVVPLWVVGVAAAAALVLVALAAFAWTRPDPKAIESGADAARAAAERAVVPVLSYDYRTLDAGQTRAESWLTPHYRDKDYAPLFATIKKNAPGTQTVVTTKVVDSSVVRAGQDRVEVLLLVDRPTTNKAQTTPVTYEDHVTVTMARTGGRWLVDDMTT